MVFCVYVATCHLHQREVMSHLRISLEELSPFSFNLFLSFRLNAIMLIYFGIGRNALILSEHLFIRLLHSMHNEFFF